MDKGNREEGFDWFVIMRGSFGFVLRLTGRSHPLIDWSSPSQEGDLQRLSVIHIICDKHPPKKSRINNHLFQHALATRQQPNFLLVSTRPRLYIVWYRLLASRFAQKPGVNNTE